mgnify:CR=1 FL=1
MKKPYILCVDDDKSILISLKAQLQHYLGANYHYELAESAAEAWEVINELNENGDSISVIFSDYIMPLVKGDEFLISVHQKYPDIVKIMLTGHADGDAVLHTKEQANLAAVFGKPWDISEILACIKNALSEQ